MMDAEELLRRAWQAVESAAIPDQHRGLAFKEAIDFIRSAESTTPEVQGSHTCVNGSTTRRKDPKATVARRPREEAGADATGKADAFYSSLVHESGVDLNDLTDILNLTGDGKVQVVVPTRKLGTTLAEQARTIVALVAGARSKGLRENPVKADAVRDELQRKQCYQGNNFAAYHLGPLKGFNAGSNRSEILVNSKWLAEFVAAVSRAHGRDPARGVE